MRVLKFLISFLFVTVVAGTIIALLAREVMLLVGVNQIKQTLNTLRHISTNGTYTNDCLAMGSYPTKDEPLSVYQIRFISDNEYVSEIICNQFPLSPIEIAQVQLKPFITKKPGQSGIIFGSELSGVVLSVLGREAMVFIEDEEIGKSYGDTVEAAIQSGPVASCGGFGFSCCQNDFEQGSGDQLLGVTDCPKSCHAICLDRPVVLSFNTSPFYDPKTRVVSVASGQSVTFSYVISDSQADSFSDSNISSADDIIYMLLTFLQSFMSDSSGVKVSGNSNVTIKFGDGQQSQLTDLQGTTDHAYTCKQRSCSYRAQLIVENIQGISSADTMLSIIDIKVTN